MLSIGLVGLPNAGKSTLFNLLTKRSVPAENFPFCTIDPHDGIVSVPDERVDTLGKLVNAQKLVHAAIEFRDIAGLVKDAHSGAGLGNKFLSHIREVDMILMVIRTFENDNIIHVENRINPVDDYEILMLELILADLATLEKTIPRIEKDLKTSKDNYGADKISIANAILTALQSSLPANSVDNKVDIEEEVLQFRKSLNLLTDKPILKLANIVTDGLNKDFKSDFSLDVKLENELQDMSPEDREELGVDKETGLDKMIQRCYTTLNLSTFLTAGEMEAKAWTFKTGMAAPLCAGIIHTDFTKNFIKAEVIKYKDFVELGGRKGAAEKGKLNLEGKEYIMQDGDVVEFKIGK
jgi:ribosome-binding ATPase